MIRTERLTKIYNRGESREVVAVDGVSLEIGSGDFLVVSGPSGSGKTTLLCLIGLLTRPTRGKIFLNDREVSSYSDSWQTRTRREKMGFVFQQHNLLPQFLVWENVSLPLLCRDVGLSERKRIALNVLHRLGLGSRSDFKTAQLSVGEQQRVAIARALVTDPEIVLADEPTASVDVETAADILEIFRHLKESGKTIIAVSHDPALVSEGDTTVELRSGVLAQSRRM